MNGNSWAGELYRQHSLLVCACVYERGRGRELGGGVERRDSAAIARAVIQITTVLSSSNASHYSACSLWFLISTTHPLDPLRGNLQHCRDSPAAAAWEGENRRNGREGEKLSQTDRWYWYRRERQQKRCGKAVAKFFFYHNGSVYLGNTQLINRTRLEFSSITTTTFRSKVRIAIWRDSWFGLDTSRTTPSSHIQEKCSPFEWGLSTLPNNWPVLWIS